MVYERETETEKERMRTSAKVLQLSLPHPATHLSIVFLPNFLTYKMGIAIFLFNTNHVSYTLLIS